MSELITDVTIEKLKAILDDVPVDSIIEDDGGIYVKDGLGFPIWISIIHEGTILKLMTLMTFRDREAVDELESLKLANLMNATYFPNSVCVSKGKLVANAFLPIRNGITPQVFLEWAARCGSSFIGAVREHDTKDLFD